MESDECVYRETVGADWVVDEISFEAFFFYTSFIQLSSVLFGALTHNKIYLWTKNPPSAVFSPSPLSGFSQQVKYPSLQVMVLSLSCWSRNM